MTTAQRSPWLTAITSLLARMSYVSCDMCLTSQPMMSGAYTHALDGFDGTNRFIVESECSVLQQNAERNRLSP